MNSPDVAVPSPCIDVCRMAEDKSVCLGCHRTLAEIAAWGGLSDPEKIQVLASVQTRRELEKAKTLPS